MQWNAYLANAIAWLLLLVPASIAAVKLGFPRVRWSIIWLVTPVLSWIVSVSYFQAFIPNMGYGAALAQMFGWAVMLPLLGCFSMIWFVKRWRGTRTSRLVAVLLVLIVVALPVVASFRWLPVEDAKNIAREELMRRGITDFRVGDAEKTSDGWTVYAEIPNHQRYPIYLSRSGFCTGVGG